MMVANKLLLVRQSFTRTVIPASHPVKVVWCWDVAEKHKPFPANALTDTRTVTMGEPSKVER